jgi:hypothetical protein
VVLAVFTVELKGIGAETDGDIVHCQPRDAQYNGVLKFCDKEGKHFGVILDGRGEASNVRDVSRGDRATINYVNLAGSPESGGGDVMLADKVLVYKRYSSSTAIYKGRSGNRLSIK